MKRISFLFFLLLLMGCKTNPFTGKSTLNFYENSGMFPMSFAQYDAFLKEHKVIQGTSDAQQITEIGQRIAKAAEIWLNANGYQGYLRDYRWEYNLVDDPIANAWCMPGGKIVFYTGILPICQNETGIAVVMGHEVAHALADHGAQRMSAQSLQELGMVAGNVALQKESDRELFNSAYGVGATVGVMLPFSRSHESEADKIGLKIMAIAGFDPAEAPELWKRMKTMNKGGTPEFLSTHPSNDRRISDLTRWVPEALAEAKRFGVTSFQ